MTSASTYSESGQEPEQGNEGQRELGVNAQFELASGESARPECARSG